MCFMVIEKFYYFLCILTFIRNQIFIWCLLLMPAGSSLWVSQLSSFMSVNVFVSALDLGKFSLSMECRHTVVQKEIILFVSHELFLMTCLLIFGWTKDFDFKFLIRIHLAKDHFLMIYWRFGACMFVIFFKLDEFLSSLFQRSISCPF